MVTLRSGTTSQPPPQAPAAPSTHTVAQIIPPPQDSSSSTPPLVEWYFQADSPRGGWTPFGAAASHTIEQAFQNLQPPPPPPAQAAQGHTHTHTHTGAPTAVVQFDVNQGHRIATYEVNFGTMKQTNLATYFQRAVKRRLAAGAPGGVNVWSWEDDFGSWIPMDHDTSAFLDVIHHQKGYQKCVFYAASNVSYECDLGPPTPTHTTEKTQRRTDTGRIRLLSFRPATAPPTPNLTAMSIEARVNQLGHQLVNVTHTLPSDDICAICHEGFTAANPALKLTECVHYFHWERCARAWMLRHGKCPMCNFMYAEASGDQPDGTMQISLYAPGQITLPGYESAGTYVINYIFPAGIQVQGHPSPGHPYPGTHRQAYIPATEEGKMCVSLLRRCFYRKMTFTIGTSVTTGQHNVIVWNGVHHKTSPMGGVARYGYPDPGYLTRLRAELTQKGIR